MASTSAAIEALDADVQQRVERFLVTSSDQPAVLHHYTGQAGFLGIVSSCSLWATQIQYLNDAQELRLATKEIDRHLQDRQRTAPQEILGSLCDYTASAALRGLSQRRCVVSFTEEGDQLSQWRGYCPEGTGFSVGFHADDLAAGARTQTVDDQPWSFGPVQYEPEAVERFGVMVAEHLVELSALLLEVEHDGRKVLERLIGRFLGLATSVGPFLKHPAFREEREWRAVSPPVRTGRGHVHHRPGGATLRPYCLFRPYARDGRMRLADVICAPTTEPTLVTDAAWSVLLEAHVAADGVRPSRVPYRSW